MLQRCKILGRTISFTLRYIGIRKHFLKYHFPLCASKSFCMKMCYHILHIVWKWLAGTRGGEDVQQPKNPGPITLECVGILKIFCYLALGIRFTYCTDTTCTTLEAQKQHSGNQKNRRIRPKPSMIL